MANRTQSSAWNWLLPCISSCFQSEQRTCCWCVWGIDMHWTVRHLGNHHSCERRIQRYKRLWLFCENGKIPVKNTEANVTAIYEHKGRKSTDLCLKQWNMFIEHHYVSEKWTYILVKTTRLFNVSKYTCIRKAVFRWIMSWQWQIQAVKYRQIK